jgi:hypothetical protein
VPCKFTNTEVIAYYIDTLLKPGSEKLSDEAVDRELEECAFLFSCIHDKDVFAGTFEAFVLA